MSLKENVDYIKEEISTQETFLEKFLQFEKFYKKYKKVIFGVISVSVLSFIGLTISDYVKEQDLIRDNMMFNKVLSNGEDKISLEYLKQNNQQLYKLAIYIKTKDSSTDLEFLKELSIYSEAIKENNIDKISSVSVKEDFLLKDFAIFNKALIQAQNGKYKEAKETLSVIAITSDIRELVDMLNHFLLTK
ncbi:MAG: hypothetical protein U9Q30_07345 [Campylobacterota bacterium]|nr:hypothetical protein [Campylobacterota bacterium]